MVSPATPRSKGPRTAGAHRCARFRSQMVSAIIKAPTRTLAPTTSTRMLVRTSSASGTKASRARTVPSAGGVVRSVSARGSTKKIATHVCRARRRLLRPHRPRRRQCRRRFRRRARRRRRPRPSSRHASWSSLRSRSASIRRVPTRIPAPITSTRRTVGTSSASGPGMISPRSACPMASPATPWRKEPRNATAPQCARLRSQRVSANIKALTSTLAPTTTTTSLVRGKACTGSASGAKTPRVRAVPSAGEVVRSVSARRSTKEIATPVCRRPRRPHRPRRLQCRRRFRRRCTEVHAELRDLLLQISRQGILAPRTEA